LGDEGSNFEEEKNMSEGDNMSPKHLHATRVVELEEETRNEVAYKKIIAIHTNPMILKTILVKGNEVC